MDSMRICEGMPVVDALGRGTGEVGALVLGATSRGPRFVVVREGGLRKEEHLVPCEAIGGVDPDGRLLLQLTREQVEMLPDYRGRPPTDEEARHAYALLGGRADDPLSGEGRHTVPFEDSIPAPHATPGRPTLVEIEYLVLDPDARAREGYRDEWTVGGGPGP